MTDARMPGHPETIFAWAGVRFAGAPAALFALDSLLADVLRTTSQPIVGQMRLTWWHEALTRLETSIPAHPVLQSLARDVLPLGVTGEALARTVEGWEALLDEPVDVAGVARHGGRGETLFAAMARVWCEEADARTLAAGRGWALADLAAHATDPQVASLARDAAKETLEAALRGRWRGPRAIGAMARDALLAVHARGTPDGPRRAARVLAQAFTAR